MKQVHFHSPHLECGPTFRASTSLTQRGGAGWGSDAGAPSRLNWDRVYNYLTLTAMFLSSRP